MKVLRRPVESAQYASALHQALLTKHGLVGSMSRKGNSWDNAVMERFFLKLKMERVWQRDYANHAEATSDIADYIVSCYDSMRLHSKLASQGLRASIGNHTTYRGVRNNLTRTGVNCLGRPLRQLEPTSEPRRRLESTFSAGRRSNTCE